MAALKNNEQAQVCYYLGGSKGYPLLRTIGGEDANAELTGKYPQQVISRGYWAPLKSGYFSECREAPWGEL